ncbi:MAG: phosphoenolpyruvate-utilizing N-terminal domain-containing protein [Fodinibius sp.]|nr:phosphoenolpyruvate-utilizing N-terminal domain-containing protein [Fodinibius sp.]
MSNQTETTEHFLHGAPGSPGIVIGQCSLYQRRQPRVSDDHISEDEVEEQVDRFREARQMAEQELGNMLDNQHDDSVLELVQTQVEMLKDPELSERIIRNIEANKQPADLAVKQAFETYLKVIRQAHDQSLERSVDITDVRDRLIQILHDSDEIVQRSNFNCA